MRVGVFDSGLGGLTVVQAMMKQIKGAHIYYIADTKHAPYGEKSPQQILHYTLAITQYFIDHHQIDALVIACNTATTVAIATLRARYPHLIIIGTEPGLKPAIETTQRGKVGVLATPATLQSEKYQQLSSRLVAKSGVELYEQACPGLVEQIEAGRVDHDETRQLLEGWLKPMRVSGVDTIVLGCTHYPLAAETITRLMQRPVTLIHTGDAIAKRLLTLAQERGHRNSGALSVTLYATGEIDEVSVAHILGEGYRVRGIAVS